MPGVTEVMWGGVLPTVVAASMFSLVLKLSSRAEAAWLCGLSAGYLAGNWGLEIPALGIWPAIEQSLKPAEARDWLPLAVLAAAAIDGLAMLGRKAAWGVWALRAVLCAWLPWRLLAGSVYLPKEQFDFGFETQAWSSAEAMVWIGCAAVFIGLFWLSAKFASENTLPRLRASLATLVAFGGTATIALSGSLTTGQLLGVLTAALVGCGMAAAAWRVEQGPEAAAGPLLVAFCGVLIIARFLLSPELGLATTLLLLAAIYPAIGWIGPAGKPSIRWQFALRTLICLVAVGACIVPAAREFAASQAQESANPYQNYSP